MRGRKRMKKGNCKAWAITAAGLVLLAAGLVMVKVGMAEEGILPVLPYVLIGIGAGAFGQGTGELLSARAIRNHPEIAREKEIEQADERNVALGNRAKAKAFDIMIFVFGALLLSFALMRVALAAVLLLCFSYLFVLGCGVYFRIRYEKEM